MSYSARPMARTVHPRQRLIHRLIYAGIALALFAGIAFAVAQQAKVASGGSVTVDYLEKNIGQDPYDFIVIDVRTPDEYRAGHIPHSLNMPIDQLGRRLGELAGVKDRQFAVVCESGGRSKQGVEMLRRAGFQSVVDVPEGTRGWRASGRPLVTESRAPIHDLVEQR